MIAEGERHLARAARFGRPGRFQIEAAIHSVHAERARTGVTDWKAIALFYERLGELSPVLGSAGSEGGGSGGSHERRHRRAPFAQSDRRLGERSIGRTGPCERTYSRNCTAFPKRWTRTDRALRLTEDAAVRRQLLDSLTEISELREPV